jgi:23S rRNA (adenine2503-C2)-methyltransferase
MILENMENRPDILNLSLDELTLWLNRLEVKAYRAKQIFRWIHTGRIRYFADMTDLSKELRGMLSENFIIGDIKTTKIEESRDGCRKYLLTLSDNHHVETVLIPEENHFTICISSQVGCAQGCAFCLTARSGFIRNLSASEIISQIRNVEQDLPDPARLTNIVVMGMGEPLYNFDNMVKALKIIMDGDFGMKYSSRRVTLSTCGVVPKLVSLGNILPVNLAVSLNAADNMTRNRLMPINRRYPLEKLLEACRNYPLPPRRRITFEYILIKGVNDSPVDAMRLAKILTSIKAKVNLIPFNEHEGCDFQRPEESIILKFQDTLIRHNYTTVIRKSKGEDISAACGQLRGRMNPGLNQDQKHCNGF